MSEILNKFADRQNEISRQVNSLPHPLTDPELYKSKLQLIKSICSELSALIDLDRLERAFENTGKKEG